MLVRGQKSFAKGQYLRFKNWTCKVQIDMRRKRKLCFFGSIYYPMTIGKVFQEYFFEKLWFPTICGIPPNSHFFLPILPKQTFLINFLLWLICIFLSEKKGGYRQKQDGRYCAWNCFSVEEKHLWTIFSKIKMQYFSLSPIKRQNSLFHIPLNELTVAIWFIYFIGLTLKSTTLIFANYLVVQTWTF